MFKSRRQYFMLVVAVTAACVSVSPVSAFAAFETSASALQMAQSLAVEPGVITGADYLVFPSSGSANALVTTPLAAFPRNGSSYAILSTGDARSAELPNSSPSTSGDGGGNGVRGDSDYDVSILKIDIKVPAGLNCLRTDFRFLSEEYPEFIGSTYNDAFIAELDQTTWKTTGSVISDPDNFAFDPNGNPITINAAGVTSMTAANAVGTTYDGATPVLVAATPITSGAHTLYLSIFDQGDRGYDSAAMIDNLRFVQVANVAKDCKEGAQLITKPTTLYQRYVALGDSYSSGEGAVTDQNKQSTARLLSATNSKTNQCHRSRNAYPYRIKDSRFITDKNFVFRACSGAILADFIGTVGKGGQWNEGPQLNAISPGDNKPDLTTGLITVSVGGNDVGFPSIVSSCTRGRTNTAYIGDGDCIDFANKLVTKGLKLLSEGGTILVDPSDKATTWKVCDAKCQKDKTPNGVRLKVPSLSGLYQTMHKRAPNAKIRVMLYPRLFPATPKKDCRVGQFRSKSGITFNYDIRKKVMSALNPLIDKTDSTIMQQVAKAKATGIDIKAVEPRFDFAAHGLCDSQAPWLNGIIFKTDFLLDGPSAFSFHPNATGQERFALAMTNSDVTSP